MILKAGAEIDGCAVVTSNGTIPAGYLCGTRDQAEKLRDAARELNGQRCAVKRVRIRVEIIDDLRNPADE